MKADRFIHTKRKPQKPQKTAEQQDARNGKFNFSEIHGFKLKEVEWTVPDKQTRKRRRSQFNSVREEFLKELGANHEDELRAMGLKDKAIDMIKKGHAPQGYNVHHKLPIHGGGQNVFSNLILMPIPPHDDLHHIVMDPQVAQMQSGQSKKVMIPWTDDMVYHPEKDKGLVMNNAKPNNRAVMAKRMRDGR